MMKSARTETKNGRANVQFQMCYAILLAGFPSGIMEGFELLTAIRFNPTETRIPDSGFPVKLRS